jgi:hypothetical protein
MFADGDGNAYINDNPSDCFTDFHSKTASNKGRIYLRGNFK